MDEWLVRIVIAIVAGAFGAIVRPWIADTLFERRRHRTEQRAMIDEWLGIASWRMLVPASACVAIEKGCPPQKAAMEANDLMKEWVRKQAPPHFPWAPERLHDQQLRTLFAKMQATLDRMSNDTADVARGANPDGYAGSMRESADLVEEVRRSINGRVAKLRL